MPTPIGGAASPPRAAPCVEKLLTPHRGVERDLRRREVDAAHERECLLCAALALHAGVLPLDRERTGVADPVQRAHDGVEVDVSVPRRDEVPAALAVAEVEVRREDRAPPVEPPLRVLY